MGAFSAMAGAGFASFGNGLGAIALRSASGGILGAIQGGNFGHSFASAGLTAAVMPGVGHISNHVARTITGAVVGGTISRVTGGKFANGAVTGAIMAAMVGDRAVADENTTVTAGNGKAPAGVWSEEGIPEYLKPPRNEMLDAANQNALDGVRLRPDGEWVGHVEFVGPVGWVASDPVFVPYRQSGNALVVEFPYVVPSNAQSIYHTHPATGVRNVDRPQNTFGPGDHRVLYSRGIPNYMRAPNNAISVMEMTFAGPQVTTLRNGRWR